MIYILLIIWLGIYSLEISLKCSVCRMREEKFGPNEIRAFIITKSTKADCSIRVFLAEILHKNRGMQFIFLTI